MLKSNKGNYGYFTQEKKRYLIITAILFAVPLLIFITGLIQFHKRETVFTVVAVVGCLPACKATVNLLMLWKRKSLPAEEYEKIKSKSSSLVMAYEMYITSYEKSGYVDAFAICGNQVVGYSSDEKIDAEYIANHVQKLLHQNGFGVKVMILRELNPYLERLTSLERNKESLQKDIAFQPDERYPDLSREELIKHTILALSL